MNIEELVKHLVSQGNSVIYLDEDHERLARIGKITLSVGYGSFRGTGYFDVAVAVNPVGKNPDWTMVARTSVRVEI